MKTIVTRWQVRDVGENGSMERGEITLRVKVTHNNVGSPLAFDSAVPTDKQVANQFGVSAAIAEILGDDTHVYIAIDGEAIGEMHCLSHEALSPIRPKNKISE